MVAWQNFLLNLFRKYNKFELQKCKIPWHFSWRVAQACVFGLYLRQVIRLRGDKKISDHFAPLLKIIIYIYQAKHRYA
jgi:hypothetical protein